MEDGGGSRFEGRKKAGNKVVRGGLRQLPARVKADGDGCFLLLRSNEVQVGIGQGYARK